MFKRFYVHQNDSSINNQVLTNLYNLVLKNLFMICLLIFLNQLPHMLPSEEGFSAAVSALGIDNKDGVIIYDGKGIYSAARVWWYVTMYSIHVIII